MGSLQKRRQSFLIFSSSMEDSLCDMSFITLVSFFDKDTSIEDYCLDHSISIPTFTKWLKWLEDNISILREIGLFQDKKENRKTLKEWIHEIKTRSTDWLIKSLRLLNRSLFQRRRMPDNTMYHFLLRSLKN